jgi:hypothetical protein
MHVTPANIPFARRASERLRHLAELRERAKAAGVNVQVDEQHGDPAPANASSGARHGQC